MPRANYLKTFPPLTDSQKQIIEGSLLGDASLHHIESKNRNWKFQKTQSWNDCRGNDKKGYLEWHKRLLAPYSNGDVRSRRSKHLIVNNKDRLPTNIQQKEDTYKAYVYTTHCHPVFTSLGRKWYLRDSQNNLVKRNGRKVKIVPTDLRLTALSLCVWYMDDGSADAKDANIILHTQGFAWRECIFLQQRLRDDLDIISKVRAKDDKPIIYVGRKSYFDFIDMVRPHVKWSCFRHKLDVETYCKSPNWGETHYNSILTETNVREIYELNNSLQQKEIARRMNLTSSMVSMILSGDRWNHMKNRPKRKICRRPRIAKEVKDQVFSLRKQRYTQSQIANQLCIHQASVSRILKSLEK